MSTPSVAQTSSNSSSPRTSCRVLRCGARSSSSFDSVVSSGAAPTVTRHPPSESRSPKPAHCRLESRDRGADTSGSPPAARGSLPPCYTHARGHILFRTVLSRPAFRRFPRNNQKTKLNRMSSIRIRSRSELRSPPRIRSYPHRIRQAVRRGRPAGRPAVAVPSVRMSVCSMFIRRESAF